MSSTSTEHGSGEAMELAGAFPPVDRDTWMEAVTKILRGRDFDRVLVNNLEDGISTQPLYTAADELAEVGLPGDAPYVRGARAAGAIEQGWDIRQVHGIDNAASVNDAVLRDLQRGVTSIELITVGLSEGDMARMLEGVLLDLAPIGLFSAESGVGPAGQLLELFESYEAPNSTIEADLGCDPVARYADHGTVGQPIDDALAEVAALASDVHERFAKIRTVRASAMPFAQSGASAADELAFGLSSAVGYLRALTAAGMGIDDALDQILWTLAVDTDQFMGIAKLRAARRIWARMAEASGADPSHQAPVIQAVTSVSMLTTRDPWVNMLRGTIATAAAALGGADIVTVHPFDSLLGKPDALGRRIARNTQLILQQESNLHRVIDPAGGSWYLEQLTDQIANAAWDAFQAVEAEGGVVAALTAGWVQSRIAATWEAREAAVAKRSRPITGVSEFPHIGEEPVDRDPYDWGTAAGDNEPPNPEAEPLPIRRLAEPWESVRDDVEASEAAAAGNASIFLANLGPIASHTARATFAKNLFEAGGIEGLTNDGFSTAADLTAAFSASGCKAAVLCGADTTYDDLAAEMAAALKAAGCTWLCLAGNPGDNREAWTAAGIDHYVHLGANVLGVVADAAQLFTGENP